MSGGTLEVSLALNGPIILSRGIRELDSNPVSCRKMGSADETRDTRASVLDLDGLSNLKVGKYAHGCKQSLRARETRPAEQAASANSRNVGTAKKHQKRVETLKPIV